METELVQPWRLRAATTARLGGVSVGISPRTGQSGVTPKMHLVGGRGGRATQRGASQEEGQRSSAEGAPYAPREVGCLSQQGEGGVEDPPKTHHSKDYSAVEGGAASSTEEGANLQEFTPDRSHLSLQEVYGDFPYHNDGTHLTGGSLNDVVWKSCWGRRAVQSSIWSSTPPDKVWRQFTAVLDEYW